MGSDLPGFFAATEMPSAQWWEALWPDPAAVLNAAGLITGTEAIDLCAGDGWFTLHIAKAARHVVAIDIDRTMLEAARHRLCQNGIGNCDFIVGDAYEVNNLTLRPADFVFLANALHGVPDRPRLVRAVREALRPDGRFVIVNWHQRAREETTVLGEPRGPKTELRLSPKETVEAVEAGGLMLARIVELPPYHYGAVFNRSAS
jgi:ubiquinone/menaquinone biosynthesis C-methylase UbiE